MKSFVFITLAALALTTYGVYKFVSTKNKTDSVADYQAHLQNIASRINASNGKWKAVVHPRFANMDQESIKGHFMRQELRNSRKSTLPRVFYAKTNVSMPESFDARDQWGSQCPSLNEVRDQSTCGSCWAVSTAAAMSDRICIASAGMKKDVRVSSAHLMECCTDCGNGCNGGYPEAAYEFWAKGIVTGNSYQDGSCYPYPFAPCSHHVKSDVYAPCGESKPTPQCQHSCQNGADWTKSTTYGQNARSVSGESDMMTELKQNGPFTVAFTVYEDFLTYKSGVYTHQEGSALGGHAVKLTGWGVEADGTKYWVIVNNWNNTWGDMGTFKVLRGSDEVGIEDDGAAGDAL